MSYLEELLPEFRKGAKIRLPLWEKGQYLRYDAEHRNIVNDKGDDTDIMGCHLSSDRWEFYREPIDWDYIIKNKCLCWFSNSDNSANIFGYLQEYNHKHFVDIKFNLWEHCRPVRRDEVTFYEDKKDE